MKYLELNLLGVLKLALAILLLTLGYLASISNAKVIVAYVKVAPIK